MAELILPAVVVQLFPGTPRHMELAGDTVRDVLAALDARVPGMADRLLTAGPEIREHIRVFVDTDLAGLDTPVPEGAVVRVVAAVSGG